MTLSPSILAAAAAGLLAAGCVIVPVTTASYDPDCRIVTHHMEMQAVQVAAINGCRDQGCAIAVLTGAGLVAVSAVVSGSIVVAGNVVYWAEHRAGCAASVPAAAAPSAV